MEAPPESRDDPDALRLQFFLDHDPRPAFVIDLERTSNDDKDPFEILFSNDALKSDDALFKSITPATSDDPERSARRYGHFRRWILRSGSRTGSQTSITEYAGVFWTTYVISDRYQVVAGNECRHHASTATSTSQRSSHSRTSSNNKDLPTLKLVSRRRSYDPKPPPTFEDTKIAFPDQQPATVSTDWTAPEPSGTLTPHETFARNTDWASTPLGPMSSWSAEFRSLVNLVMRNPHPCTLFWGEELTMLYNDAYRIEVAGNKHPGLMGSGFFGPFAELWEGIKALFEECARTGKSIRKENDRLLIERYGYLEETFFSWSWVPMYGNQGKVLGFYNAPFETTYQTVSSRRMETLQRLGEEVAAAKSVSSFWKGVIAGLQTNPYDIVFATVYTIGETEGSDTASASSSSNIFTKRGILEGAIGVPEGHEAANPKIDFQSRDGMIPHLRDAILANAPIVLRDAEGTLPEVLLDGIKFGGFQIPSKEVLIIPICSTNGENTLAVLTIGLNPRRQYDHDYQTFIAMLNRQVTTSLASVLLAEEEAKRNRTAAEVAALQQERLTEELALQTSRLRRMTELSPLEMFLISPDGVLLEANDRYYEMTNNTKEQTSMSFMDTLHESSVPLGIEMWRRLTVERKVQSEEILMSYNFNTEIDEMTGKPIEPWMLASALPEIGADGQIRSIMGSITDISHLHFARGLQDQRLREAEEVKIQQNAFIDITSHEMRNPLSAVLICAEDIRESLQQHQFEEKYARIVTDCIEAANTISLCVQHQKSIVDDVLTISKLNSKLLFICPQPTEPVKILQQAMNMFRNETQSKGIVLSLHLHPSMRDLNVVWVMLDPGRILQITVNLLTNAIKFTQQSDHRSIAVHVGASISQPIPSTKGFDYVPVREQHLSDDVVGGSDWGTGSVLYLRVRVTDTGCGLTLEEKQKLFERFAQASPRTHAQYGGSGLGLFISRQLAELHGGQIGAASEDGVGSTFGFYVQCRQTNDPAASARLPDSPVAPPAIKPTTPIAESRPRPSPLKKKNVSDTQLTQPSQDIPLSPQRPRPTSILEQPHDQNRKVHVLVVEDNLVNQRIVRKQLEKAGCVVAVADNGVYALEYLKTTDVYSSHSSADRPSASSKTESTSDVPSPHPLQIILMDLEMPEMGGLECVEHIRRWQSHGTITRHIPVIAVTANVRAEQIRAAKETGMDDLVSKPFRIRELVQVIEQHVGWKVSPN